ncbi:Putative auto-transporter adhesin, head GIN domain [Polaribacter sp. KT25b]|uniref:head GIN domain-containing protein n=1 Tax=Polaribacter sp. KT25b TaxID=1855336 RepID=UPI00087B8EF5|nr:head GIN domain-containing protein [Polaribacter sp. KT25b]SDS13241.1 Putative auto-transporter adhesin, head GIN domain [Polaribacter sp. KT25b]
MFKKIILTAIIFTVTIAVNAQKNERIRGNGKVITVNRTTSNYDGVAVGGSFDVILVKGKEGKIIIEGEENIIPYIVTEIEKDLLQIKFKKNTNINTTKRLTVTVYFESIEKISLAGSGNITSNETIKNHDFTVALGGSGNITLNVEANEISSNIAGSGNIELTGKSNELTCSIAGSGSLKSYDLTTDILNTNIAGSGSVKITVDTKIKAKVVGSGSVYYKGNPTDIDIKSVGSGSVIDRN